MPEAESPALRADRGLTVDKSIQWAYIHAIRNARHFLYIENQYFLGGSGEWENKVSVHEGNTDFALPGQHPRSCRMHPRCTAP